VDLTEDLGLFATRSSSRFWDSRSAAQRT